MTKRKRKAPSKFTPSTGPPKKQKVGHTNGNWTVTEAPQSGKKKMKGRAKRHIAAGPSPGQVSVGDLQLQIQALQETVASMHADAQQRSPSPPEPPLPRHSTPWREPSVHGGRPVPDPLPGPSQDSIPWQEHTPHGERPVDTATGPANSDGKPTMQIIGTQSLPLYTFVPNEVCKKLDDKEYIDLKSLMDKDDEQNKRSKFSQRKPIIPWLKAYIRMMSYAEKEGLHSTQHMLVHLDNVLSLAHERKDWAEYDEKFRTQSASAGYNFATTRVELYAKSVTSTNSQKQPFRAPQSHQTRVPYGFCVQYHQPYKRCNEYQCKYSHVCPHCSSRHPMYRCEKKDKKPEKERKEKQKSD